MSDRQSTTGEPVPADGSRKELKANGQQKGYVVLTPEERAKGWVKPYRESYVHEKCGALTRMGRALSAARLVRWPPMAPKRKTEREQFEAAIRANTIFHKENDDG